MKAQASFCEISKGLLDSVQQREEVRLGVVQTSLDSMMARILESGDVAGRCMRESRDAVGRASKAMHVGALAGGYGHGGVASVDPCPYPPHVPPPTR